MVLDYPTVWITISGLPLKVGLVVLRLVKGKSKSWANRTWPLHTSFLQNGSETASTKRQRHSQTQEQSRRSVCFETNESTESKKSDQVLAKKLIQVLKNCINQGQDDEQVTNMLFNHLGSRSKFSPGTVSPKPKYRTSY